MTIGESGSESQCNTYCFIPFSLDAKYELINYSKLAYAPRRKPYTVDDKTFMLVEKTKSVSLCLEFELLFIEILKKLYCFDFKTRPTCQVFTN